MDNLIIFLKMKKQIDNQSIEHVFSNLQTLKDLITLWNYQLMENLHMQVTDTRHAGKS
jgi:hypothetical protein